MGLKISAEKIQNKTALNNFLKSKQTRILDGRRVSALTKKGAQKNKMLNLLGAMQSQGSLKIQSGQQHMSEEEKQNIIAKEIFATMGCECITDPHINKEDFSLIPSQIDSEILLNPNKIDLGLYKEITKGKVQFDKIIKKPESSFYTIDEQLSKNIQKEFDKIKANKEGQQNYMPLVADVFDMNLNNPKSPTIRALQLGNAIGKK